MARPRREHEVTFICPAGQLEIRMMDTTTRAVCEAAKTLGARYFIMIDGWSARSERIVARAWGVFDMRTAFSNTPLPGEWSINDPLRRFPLECLDAAVMFALHRKDR